ncbi:MAG: class I SAM-dependent methyltransferase [Desulfobacterales bacterium]|nr:MAG: class I SAM-dependent methyltransferase [Desulfobacterales bacterium]
MSIVEERAWDVKEEKVQGATRGGDPMKRWIKIERIPGPLASVYEKATRLVIESYYRRIAAEIGASLAAGRILDLGTGPGCLPIEIVKAFPLIRVVGVDLSPKLIRMAQRSAAQAGVADRLSFQVGNAARLRFADACFDMVISTGMLHALRDPVKVLNEIYRVLKRGGEAWIYDPAQVASQIDQDRWKALLTYRERFFLWLFTLAKLHKPLQTYTPRQVVAIIEATHFKAYRIDEGKHEIRIKLSKQ